MRIVTTHTNMDFDALASVVAGTLLYPGACGVLPSHIMPGVRSFLAIHQDLFQVQPRKGFDETGTESLIVVDTNAWQRLDRMESLSNRKDLEIICWDHHMEGATIDAGEEHREEIGATITLLVEEMQRLDTAFTPMHATLFLLGIYDDTGCLCFSSATHRDAHMAGFLLHNGADLNIVSAFLTDTVDEAHAQVFSSMLATARVLDVGGLKIGICLQPVKSGLTMLANLVGRYREFKGLDAALAIFPTDHGKCMVIGRSNPRGLDIGRIMRTLGGGGHPGAGSAVVRETEPETLAATIQKLACDAVENDVRVSDIMSRPDLFLADGGITMDDARTLLSERHAAALMICDDHVFQGSISNQEIVKAERSGRLNTPVKGFMKRDIPRVPPDYNTRQALDLMTRSGDGVLPVVQDNRLIGVLTRGDILLEIYNLPVSSTEG